MKLLIDENQDSRVRLDAAKFLTSYGLGAPPRELLDASGAIQLNIVIPGQSPDADADEADS